MSKGFEMERTAKRALKRGVVLVMAFVMTVFALSGCATSAPENTATTVQSSGTTDLTNEINTSQLPDSSFLYDASIADLANATSYMNGQTVQVTGEVVGDRINDEYKSDHCWITLQEPGGAYAEIAVYIPKTLTSSIDTYGSYGKQGTTLQVRGTFNLACKDHDGVSCLHATNATKTAPGKTLDVPLNSTYLSFGLVFLVIGLALLLAHHKLKEREL